MYQTELLEPLKHSPQDKTFFARLDAQLNKVNAFFKLKEGDNIARAGMLEKQMVALLNMQETLARRGLDSHIFSPLPRDIEDPKPQGESKTNPHDSINHWRSFLLNYSVYYFLSQCTF